MTNRAFSQPSQPRRRLLRHLGTLIFLLALFSQDPVAAQSASGEIVGVVTDQSGQAVVRAAVTVTNIDTAASEHVVADDHGRFAAPALPAGQYEVTAHSDGFAARRQEELTLHPGERVSLRLELRKALAPETLTIGIRPAELETARTHQSFLVDSQQVESLPMKDRQYLALAQLAPSVTTDAATGGLSVMGQSSAMSRVVIDGFDHTSGLTGEPQGSMGVNRASAQVSQAAVSELEVNINGYPAEMGRAGAGVLNVATKAGTNAVRGSAFEFFGDRALNASRTAGLVQPSNPRYRSNQFGGVIGGPLVRNHDFFLLSYEGLRRTAAFSQDQDLALVRVDHQFTGMGRLTGRYLDQQFTGAPFEERTRSASLSLASRLGTSVVNEARAQRATSRDIETLAHDFGTRRIQAADTISIVSGGHSMKIGADLLFDTNSVTLNESRPVVQADVNSYSAFIQDAWRAGNTVTLDLGVRYDLQTLPSVARDTNNWAPRVGVAWASSERSVLRAGYGLFYGTTPAIIPVMTKVYVANSVLVEPGFEAPQVQHANIGWEWEKYRVMTAGISYQFARGTHLPRAVEINGGAPRLFPNLGRVAEYRSTGESLYNGVTYQMRMRFFQDLYYTASYTFAQADDSGSGVGPFSFGTAADRRILPLATANVRTRADNDQHHRAVLGAMYDTTTLADARGSVIKALIGNWSLSTVYTMQSGQPYSGYAGGDINGDGNAFNDLAPGTMRNQYRLPWQASLDARIARDVYIGDRRKLSLIWEMFNARNRPNYFVLDDTWSWARAAGMRRDTPFGPTVTQGDGRVMQLAVKMTF